MEANTRLKASNRLHNDRLDLLACYEAKREITLTDVGITCQAHYLIFEYMNVQWDTKKVLGDMGQLFIESDRLHVAGHE